MDLSDPRRQQDPGAYDTWIMRDVSTTIQGWDTPFGTITDRILFGMDGRLFVIVPEDRFVFAVRQEPVIPHADDPVVLDQDTAHLKTLTRRSRACGNRQFLEIICPR